MIGIARLGDKTVGTCKVHGKQNGKIIQASHDTMTDSIGTARLGDMILADCGHTAKIVTASSATIVDSLGVARLGDRGDGTYQCTIVTASSDDLTT